MLSRAPLPYKMASVTNSVVILFTQQLLFYSCARSVGVLTQGPCWSHSHTACCTHGGGVYVEFSHNQPTNQPTNQRTNQPTNQQTNKQTNNNNNRQQTTNNKLKTTNNKNTNKQTNKQTTKQASKQTNKQTNKKQPTSKK